MRHGGGGSAEASPLDQQQRRQEAELAGLAAVILARLRAIAPHVAAIQVRKALSACLWEGR